jgi:hypothetical protein
MLPRVVESHVLTVPHVTQQTVFRQQAHATYALTATAQSVMATLLETAPPARLVATQFSLKPALRLTFYALTTVQQTSTLAVFTQRRVTCSVDT